MQKPARAPNEAPAPQKLEQIAEWAASRTFADIKPADRPYLKLLVLDAIGCAIGALGHQPTLTVRALTDALGGSGWGTMLGAGKSAPDRAAFFNAARVRHLDFMAILMVPGQSCAPS